MHEISLEQVNDEQEFNVKYFVQHMRELNSITPVFNINSETGEPEFSLYGKFFGNYPGDRVKRQALYFKKGEETVGFVMTSRFKDDEENDITVIVQFYILEAFRGTGIAMECAKKLFENFGGTIRLSYQNENKRAVNFWHKVTEQFSTYNNKDKKYLEGNAPGGDTVIQFTTTPAVSL